MDVRCPSNPLGRVLYESDSSLTNGSVCLFMTLWCTECFKYACQGIASTLAMVMEKERERESVCVCVLMTLDKLVIWQRGVWTHWFIIIKKDVNKGILSSASYLSFLASSMQGYNRQLVEFKI
jgi:hypothetical protein